MKPMNRILIAELAIEFLLGSCLSSGKSRSVQS